MENLVGKKFNLLTVIEGPIRKTTTRKIFWKCQCDCGNIKIIRGDQLKSGTTKSCGCYKNKVLIDNNIKRQTLDLTGVRFGKLVAKTKTNLRKDGRVVWLCQCDCGNEIFCDTHSLQEGKTQSCGCIKSKGEEKIKKILQENNIIFEEQKTFSNCKFKDTGYLAKFDFWVNNQFLIEYDGEQHYYYKDSPYTWNNQLNYNKVKEHDLFKNNWCKENNIVLIRIPYFDLDKIKLNDLLLNSKYIVK